MLASCFFCLRPSVPTLRFPSRNQPKVKIWRRPPHNHFPNFWAVILAFRLSPTKFHSYLPEVGKVLTTRADSYLLLPVSCRLNLVSSRVDSCVAFQSTEARRTPTLNHRIAGRSAGKCHISRTADVGQIAPPFESWRACSGPREGAPTVAALMGAAPQHVTWGYCVRNPHSPHQFSRSCQFEPELSVERPLGHTLMLMPGSRMVSYHS